MTKDAALARLLSDTINDDRYHLLARIRAFEEDPRQDPAGAKVYFEKAVQLDPDLVEAHMNLGLIYEMSGDRARARSSFETFLAKASPAQYGQIIPRVRQELATLR